MKTLESVKTRYLPMSMTIRISVIGDPPCREVTAGDVTPPGATRGPKQLQKLDDKMSTHHPHLTAMKKRRRRAIMSENGGLSRGIDGVRDLAADAARRTPGVKERAKQY